MRCLECSHGYLHPLPSEEELAPLYSDLGEDDFLGNGMAYKIADYFDAHPRALQGFHKRAINFVNSKTSSNDAEIFDFGCAMGTALRALDLAGYSNSKVFDIQAELVSAGRKRWGLNLLSGDDKEFFGAHRSSFDCIISSNILEHLADPAATIKELRTLLKPDGWLMISLPNYLYKLRLAGKSHQ